MVVDKSLLLTEPRLPRSKMGTILACVLHRTMVRIRDLRIQNAKPRWPLENHLILTQTLFSRQDTVWVRGPVCERGLSRLTKEVAGRAQTQNPLGHSLPLTTVSSKSQQSLTYADNWCPDTSQCSLSRTLCAFWPSGPHSSCCFLTADTAGSKEKKMPGTIGK